MFQGNSQKTMGKGKSEYITYYRMITVFLIRSVSQELKRKKQPNHYFASFYGDFLGPHVETNNKVVRMNEASPDNTSDFQLIYKSSAIHKSLVTLTFTAETVSFVDNRFICEMNNDISLILILYVFCYFPIGVRVELLKQ